MALLDSAGTQARAKSQETDLENQGGNVAANATLEQRLEVQRRSLDEVKEALARQAIETPSWGYGDSGTRFKTFSWPGAARTIEEKLDDAAVVHDLTGVAPSVALHIPWDKTDDYDALKRYAADRGMRIGAINPNVFQDEDYRLGSLGHPRADVRHQALGHLLECVEIMGKTGSTNLSLWFADGTNYAGQDDIRRRKRTFLEGLATIHEALPDSSRMLVEYKLFEPGFYHTDLADWGMAYAMCLNLGPKAEVLVDMGHHAQGTNIEHIVAFLLDEGRLGGFHFNNRKYADDDLIVGTVSPFELFCIYHELVKAERSSEPALRAHVGRVAYMIDQSHNIEGKVGAMVLSVLNCQTAYAKALMVDQDRLAIHQTAGDVLAAHRTLLDAFELDIRPLLAEVREEQDRHPDPMRALKESRYEERIAEERGSNAAGSGYPT